MISSAAPSLGFTARVAPIPERVYPDVIATKPLSIVKMRTAARKAARRPLPTPRFRPVFMRRKTLPYAPPAYQDVSVRVPARGAPPGLLPWNPLSAPQKRTLDGFGVDIIPIVTTIAAGYLSQRRAAAAERAARKAEAARAAREEAAARAAFEREKELLALRAGVPDAVGIPWLPIGLGAGALFLLYMFLGRG